jgi:predicted lipoprotein with Yx(FWY)xxD motif
MRRSIRYSLTPALAVGTAALVLAACGGGDSNDNVNASAASSGPGSGLVSIQDVGGTNVLADSEGRSLYSADVEKGQIRCTGACTSFWDPVAASAEQAKTASADLGLDLGAVERPEGDSQLTFKGLPLYTFTEEGPGQLEGDGFADDFDGIHFEWAAAATGSGAASNGSDNGSSESSGGYSSPY